MTQAIERLVGMAPQFERVAGGYLFRRHGHGPAIRVSEAEHDAFAASTLRTILLHAVALGLFGWLGWLLLARLLPAWSDNALAPPFGIVLSLIALALHASLRHHADAPARALAHRTPERPARDPDVTRQPSYRTIVGFTLLLLFLAAIGTRQPPAFYITFATAALMLGLFLLVRRWRFDRGLTDAQRRSAREAASAARRRARGSESRVKLWALAALLVVFVVLQMIVLLAGVLLGVLIVQKIAGTTLDDMGFGLFMAGFLPGMVLGGLFVWPLERLCKRWTGSSALHSLDFIPAGW